MWKVSEFGDLVGACSLFRLQVYLFIYKNLDKFGNVRN
jgi:hypothetical protein